MKDEFKYFWVDVEVERAEDGGVWWFMSYDLDEDDGERYPYTGIEREDDGVLEFSDMQTSETFDPDSGEAHSYVRHLAAGAITYEGQVAWATRKYHEFLRGFARAQIRNLLDEQRVKEAPGWDAAQIARVRDELLALGPFLQRLRDETGDSFAPEGNESFVFLWHVLAALKGEGDAHAAVDAVWPGVREYWGWASYDTFFERLLG